MLKGEADMAGPTEFVIVGNVLKKQRISVLGSIEKGLTMSLIGLKTRGISGVADLAGKRIGLARRTISEFYLGRFLDLHGMKVKDVVLVDLPPSKWLGAVSSGDVDAIVGWSPYSTQLQERFTNETVSWQVQSGQQLFGVIVSSNDWVAQHPETVIRFWRSLTQAEEFLIRHPDEAKAIVRKRLNYDEAYMDIVWPQTTFSISLDQSLIVAMEDEARWMISNSLTTEKQVPDFLKYIYEDGLKAVKPEVVKIIR
jgi:NitT/TauT family transport system substrate-binding protein